MQHMLTLPHNFFHMDMHMTEIILLLLVMSIITVGFLVLYRNSNYTTAEKIYWIIVILLFNILGVLVLLADNFLLKKRKI